MLDTEKYKYGDEILWYGKIFEVVQIGSVKFKDGSLHPIMYAVQTKYPYEIKIFYEREFINGSEYLYELTKPKLYRQLVLGFQQEILKNANIDPKYKIFDSKERVKYEKAMLKNQKQLLAKKIEEEKNTKKDKVQKLVVQLDYLKKSKEDPIHYPPLKFNLPKEAKEYMNYLLANKDKLPPSTLEDEEKIVEIFKNISYSTPRNPRK